MAADIPFAPAEERGFKCLPSKPRLQQSFKRAVASLLSLCKSKGDALPFVIQGNTPDRENHLFFKAIAASCLNPEAIDNQVFVFIFSGFSPEGRGASSRVFISLEALLWLMASSDKGLADSLPWGSVDTALH